MAAIENKKKGENLETITKRFDEQNKIIAEQNKFIADKFDAQAQLIAQMASTIENINARLSKAGSICATGKPDKGETKLAINRGSAGGAAAKSDAAPKTLNSMTYFRHSCGSDPEFRKQYLTQVRIDALSDKDKNPKFTVGSYEYYSAIAHKVWKNIPTDEKKVHKIKNEEINTSKAAAATPAALEADDASANTHAEEPDSEDDE